jgi:hypothetical protein
MTGADSSYERQMHQQARDLAAAVGRLEAAARIAGWSATRPGVQGHLAGILGALTGITVTADGHTMFGSAATALDGAVHHHEGQADDLTEHATAAMDSALADLEYARAAGDVTAMMAAQARAVLCETVIEDGHAARQRLHDVLDRLARHETAG